jgi:hypothetical protein
LGVASAGGLLVEDTTLMSLMNLVRSLAALVIGWTLVALGIGAMGGGPALHPDPARIPAEPSLHDALPHGSAFSKRYDLIDQSSGQCTPIRLPEEEQWSCLSVSPWRDPGGELVAVGRWVHRQAGPFCGLGVFRVSDSAVLSRVATEILPTGRPCWVPGQPGTFLFPGGDGRLHRCRLPAQGDEGGIAETTEGVAGATTSLPVTWKVKAPGLGETFLTDPVWSPEPKLRKFIIVALSLQVKVGRRSVFQPSRLWWLEINDEVDTILSAGPLTGPPCHEAGVDQNSSERYPNIAIGTGGEIHLVYLMQHGLENPLWLHSARLQLDPGSGRPRLEGGPRESRTLGEEFEKAPLLVSADGRSVFGMDTSGQVSTFSLAGKLRDSHAAGRRDR